MTEKEIKEFREEIYRTQAIEEDLKLDNLIQDDMGYIWGEKGGQEGMEESFPFTFSRDSIEKEYDYYNDYFKTNCHYKVQIIRSYALSGKGGVAIIEYRTYVHYDDMTGIIASAQDSYDSRQQIITLGEDDGFHFLNCCRIYEDCYFSNTSDFICLIDMAVQEFNKYQKNL